MQINMKDVMYFVRIMEYPTISEAAIKLNVTQSTLTKFIQKLENSLGRKLVDSGSQSAFLTTFGQDIIRRFAPHRQNLEHSLINRQAVEGKYSGLVRIALPELVYTTVLPRLAAEILSQHPKISLDVTMLKKPFLSEEEFKQHDWCFSIKALDYPNCVATYVGALSTQLFCSQSYMAKYGLPDSIEDFRDNHATRLGLLIKRPLIMTNSITKTEFLIDRTPRVILPCLLLKHIEDSDLIVESFNTCTTSHEPWVVPVLPNYFLLRFEHYLIKNLERQTIVTDFIAEKILSYIMEEVPRYTGKFIS
ncbi:MAG: LysR family transcriptional regulator [Neisseriales bacterium]|nr:MAG: LysR family transcriptional regulator [Neisseriales bacterium]